MRSSRVLAKLFLPMLLIIVTPATAETIYKWVDDQGRTHFGERPPSNNVHEQLDLKETARPESSVSTETTAADSEKPSLSMVGKIPAKANKIDAWCAHDAELCALLKQADAKCQTSYCDEATRIANCDTVVCKAERLEFMKKLKIRIASGSSQRASTYQPLDPNSLSSTIEPEFVELAAKTHGLLTAAQVKELVQKCEASRGTNCRSPRYLNAKGWQAWERPWRKLP